MRQTDPLRQRQIRLLVVVNMRWMGQIGLPGGEFLSHLNGPVQMKLGRMRGDASRIQDEAGAAC